jgi:hypothetical protein
VPQRAGNLCECAGGGAEEPDEVVREEHDRVCRRLGQARRLVPGLARPPFVVLFDVEGHVFGDGPEEYLGHLPKQHLEEGVDALHGRPGPPHGLGVLRAEAAPLPAAARGEILDNVAVAVGGGQAQCESPVGGHQCVVRPALLHEDTHDRQPAAGGCELERRALLAVLGLHPGPRAQRRTRRQRECVRIRAGAQEELHRGRDAGQRRCTEGRLPIPAGRVVRDEARGEKLLHDGGRVPVQVLEEELHHAAAHDSRRTLFLAGIRIVGRARRVRGARERLDGQLHRAGEQPVEHDNLVEELARRGVAPHARVLEVAQDVGERVAGVVRRQLGGRVSRRGVGAGVVRFGGGWWLGGGSVWMAHGGERR